MKNPRTVVVSTFSPIHDGTAKYADQLVRAMSADREVVPIGLPGSSTPLTRRLDGGIRPLRLLPLTSRGDELWLMWHPQYYISGRVWSRIAAYLSLGAVLRARRGGVNLQFPDVSPAPAARAHRRLARRLEEASRRWFWRSGARLAFHSEWERDQFLSRFGPVPAQIEIVSHLASYEPYVEVSREEARRRLDLDPRGALFLCIGFIGHEKGFDRAVRAFARAGPRGAALHVVGSILYGTEDEQRYLDELRALVDDVPGAHLMVAWVGDAEFDLWIQAADAVLAPYRSAASSGVVARAKLHRRPVIATRVGGLPEQLDENDVLVDSDEALERSLARFAHLDGAAAEA